MKLGEIKCADIICQNKTQLLEVIKILEDNGHVVDNSSSIDDGLIVGVYEALKRYDISDIQIHPRIPASEFITSNTPPCPTN